MQQNNAFANSRSNSSLLPRKSLLIQFVQAPPPGNQGPQLFVVGQKSEKRRMTRGKRAWRSSGSEASTDTPASDLPTTAAHATLAPQPATLAPPTLVLMTKRERRRERGLRRLWTAVRSVSGTGGAGDDNAPPGADDEEAQKPTPACSLPLLQVWPSQDSPRGEGDGQSFVFPLGSPRTPRTPRSPLSSADRTFPHDSGIESVQASPSPAACSTSSMCGWRHGSATGAGLLHPEHARLLRQPGLEEPPDPPPPPGRLSASSSTTSSLTSVNHSAGHCTSARTSDPWLRDDRRRSSTMTTRYSLFDALDLEYALLRAAARGSVGPYSLSESLHKLTFTQSLAFPALARGLAGKRSRSAQTQARPCSTGGRGEPGLNAFAKVMTTLVLVLLSVLVFGVVYKFVRT